MIKYLVITTVLLLTVSIAQAASPSTHGQFDRLIADRPYVPPRDDGSASDALGVQVNATAPTSCSDGCFTTAIEGRLRRIASELREIRRILDEAQPQRGNCLWVDPY